MNPDGWIKRRCRESDCEESVPNFAELADSEAGDRNASDSGDRNASDPMWSNSTVDMLSDDEAYEEDQFENADVGQSLNDSFESCESTTGKIVKFHNAV